MNQRLHDVNAPSLDNEIEAHLRGLLAEIARAAFDDRLSRTHVQLLVIIGELPLTYYSWETLGNLIVERRRAASAEEPAAGIERRPLSQHHVETILSTLKTLNYIRRERRPIPELGNKRLTTYQLAILAEKVGAARSARIINLSGRARRNSTNPPRPPRESVPARTRKKHSTSVSRAHANERVRPAEITPSISAVRLRDMTFWTTEGEADKVYSKLDAELNPSNQLLIFNEERERLLAIGKLFAKEPAR